MTKDAEQTAPEIERLWENPLQKIDWQPIETAPKDGTRILTYVPSGYYAGIDVNHWATNKDTARTGEWWRTSRADPPTHWMPLPEPPK